MQYLNSGSHLVTGGTTVLSATTTEKYLIKTIHATNVYSADTSFNLSWIDNSAGQTYYISYNVTIPVASSFQALDGTFTLDVLDSLSASTTTDNAIDLTISYMSISATTEG